MDKGAISKDRRKIVAGALWPAQLGRHHARKSNISCSLPFYLHIPLPSAYHPPSSRFKRSLATGRSRYTRTRGFCARKVLGFWTRSDGSPQFTGVPPSFSVPLSLSILPLCTARLVELRSSTRLYTRILTAGDTVPCEILPAVSRLAKRTPLCLAPFCAPLSLSLFPFAFVSRSTTTSFRIRFRIRSSFFIDWIYIYIFFFIYNGVHSRFWLLNSISFGYSFRAM